MSTETPMDLSASGLSSSGLMSSQNSLLLSQSLSNSQNLEESGSGETKRSNVDESDSKISQLEDNIEKAAKRQRIATDKTTKEIDMLLNELTKCKNTLLQGEQWIRKKINEKNEIELFETPFFFFSIYRTVLN